MDLHLDAFIHLEIDTRRSPPFSPIEVDPRDQATIDAMFTIAHRLPQHIPPGMRVLVSTRESITVEPDTIGFVTMRSTWARLGFISPPTVADPGFTGTLTLELINYSSHKILLRPDDSVYSLTTVLLKPGSEGLYAGKYQGQHGVQLPKAVKG